jgi:Ca-activated chloride channel family protein
MHRTVTFILALFLTYMVADAARASSLYDTVRKGNKFYQDGKFDEALKTYVEGQIEHAADPNLKYNIASSHYKTKNYEEAVKGYLDVAATAKDIKLQEKALYGSGNALFRQGKLEESIEYYRKALEIDPNDQDAKHNLEFAREELKRRINEAKETEKKQQEQKQKEKQKQQEQNQQKDQQNNQGQQQDQNKQQEEKQQQSQQQQQGQKQEEQKEASQQEQKEQQAQAGEQKPEEQQQAQAQSGSSENKQGDKAEEGQALPQKARPMTKEEADQWLNSVEENRDKFAKKKARESVSGQYRPEKDW